MEKDFCVICIVPTGTITKGKEYKVLDETKNSITVINDNGNKITLRRFRFSDLNLIEVKVNEKDYVICISIGKFKSITKDKKYILNKRTQDYVFVVNNNGKTMRYGKKYFKDVPKIVKPIVVEKVMKALCVYPILNELEFKKAYDFIEVNIPDMITLTNDKGEKSNYLKKRFKFEKV
jgi:hypothetical protein